MFTVKLADINIAINHDELKTFFKDYLSNERYEFIVSCSEDDLNYEETISQYKYKDIEYLKLTVYRKICEELPKYNAFLIHGSSLYIKDNDACLLAGNSGAGKSTHAKLLREYYGADMINDDKPLVRIKNGIPYIYGTPYNGKHRLSNNVSKPLKSIIFIKQDINNHIEQIKKEDAFPLIFTQVYRSVNKESLNKTLQLVNDICNYVDTYELSCNISKEAADLSFKVIV